MLPLFLAEYACDLVIFLFKAGESLLDATVRPYVVSVVCDDLYGNNNEGPHFSNDTAGRNVTRDVCKHLETTPEIEAVVQSQAAAVMVAHRVLVNLPAVVLGLFCGAWSDTRGRKFPMMAPSTGSCLAVVFYVASMQVHGFRTALLLAGAAIQGIFGKTPVISMAVNSHVADTSDVSERTRRLGRLLASSFLGNFVGALLAGVLQDVSGFVTTLCVVSGCHACSVFAVVWGVPETVPQYMSEAEEVLYCRMTSQQNLSPSSEDFSKSEFKEKRKQYPLFSWQGFCDSLMTVFKAREGRKRTIVILSLFIITVSTILKVGDQDVTVLFVQRRPLSWPDPLYGYLTAVDFAAMGLSLLFLLPIFSDVLRMSDVAIVMVGVLFRLVRCSWAGFCTETWMVFTSVVLGALGGLMTPALRAVLSKVVHCGEVGKLFSILASLETLAKLVGSAVFMGVYAATVDKLPAAAYLLEAAILVCSLAFVHWLSQLVVEDGAHGLLLSFARPYYTLEREITPIWDGSKPKTTSRIPTIRTEDTSTHGSSSHKEHTAFPLGAITP